MRTSHVPSVQSKAQYHFAQAPQANIPRSRFDRSHGHKTTFDAGQIIPILVDEVLPGDTFKLRCTAFARIATLLFPIMDNMHIDSFFFYRTSRVHSPVLILMNASKRYTLPFATSTSTVLRFTFTIVPVYSLKVLTRPSKVLINHLAASPTLNASVIFFVVLFFLMSFIILILSTLLF